MCVIIMLAFKCIHDTSCPIPLNAGVCEVTSVSPMIASFEGGATVSLEVSATCDLTSISVTGPTCSFGDQTVNATVVDSMHFECVMPGLEMPGFVPFRFQGMTADFGDFDYQDMFNAGE